MSFIHPSIFNLLSRAWLLGHQPEQRCPGFPLPRHHLLLFERDPEASPGHQSTVVTPVCPGSSPGSPASGACPEHLPREAPRKHLI